MVGQSDTAPLSPPECIIIRTKYAFVLGSANYDSVKLYLSQPSYWECIIMWMHAWRRLGSDLIIPHKEASSSAQRGWVMIMTPPLNSQVDAAVKVGVMKCCMYNSNNRTAAVTGARCVSKRVSRTPPWLKGCVGCYSMLQWEKDAMYCECSGGHRLAAWTNLQALLN